MRLLPRLVNKKDADPGLLVELAGLGRFYLFDCGGNERLPKHEVLRVARIFLSHTHIDHFIGFDRLLRLSLGEKRDVHVYGPPGLLENLAGKFAGYLWNLEEAGPDFHGHEIDGRRMRTRVFSGARQFRGGAVEEAAIDPEGVISRDEGVIVRFVALEHRVPSFGYAVETAAFPAIRSDELERMGLRDGPWVGVIRAIATNPSTAPATLEIGGVDRPLAPLIERLVEWLPGDRVAYVTDTLFTDATRDLVARLARDASVFYCEANFRDEDAERAAATCHLTASQAALFARAAGARRLVLFHISRKYAGDYEPSLAQARAIFPETE